MQQKSYTLVICFLQPKELTVHMIAKTGLGTVLVLLSASYGVHCSVEACQIRNKYATFEKSSRWLWPQF